MSNLCSNEIILDCGGGYMNVHVIKLHKVHADRYTHTHTQMMYVKLVKSEGLLIVPTSVSLFWYCAIAVGCHHWGTLGEGYTGPVYTIFATSCEFIIILIWEKF